MDVECNGVGSNGKRDPRGGEKNQGGGGTEKRKK